MNTTTDSSTVSIEPALGLILNIVASYTEYNVKDLWGRFGKRSRSVRFSESGLTRMTAICGFIAGFHYAGKTEQANKMATDLCHVLDTITNTDLVESGNSYHMKVPKSIVVLHDDGCMHSFSLGWYQLSKTGPANKNLADGRDHDDSFTTFYPLWYRMYMNGGIIFHGATKIDTYSTRLDDQRCWSVHT